VAKTTALTAAALFTPSDRVELPLLILKEGKIVEVTSRASRDLPGGAQLMDFGDAVLAPAFLDMHIHGSAGYDVMDAKSEALPAVEELLARHGVASYCPTTVTAPVDVILAALDRLASAIEGAEKDGSAGKDLRARPLGIHLEGPFISHARRGVHPPEHLLRPSLETFRRFWQAARGHIKVITIAPELEGAAEVIAEAARLKICVSLGHSDASLESTRTAVGAGARHATHTFNAMRPLNHRDPGILAEVLTDPQLTADIIADGVHLDPSIVKLFLHAKGLNGSVLITDATAATGMPDGKYHLGSFEVEVKNGVCLADGKLAGSVLTMDRAVQNIMKFAAWNLQRALRPATLNPARVLGISKQRGTLVPGAEADIVVLSPKGEVRKTIIRGNVDLD
jgi:N-acetylglucosamine-6-phosphate deacetylase